MQHQDSVAITAMHCAIIELTLVAAFGTIIPIVMRAHLENTAVSASWTHVQLTAMQNL